MCVCVLCHMNKIKNLDVLGNKNAHNERLKYYIQKQLIHVISYLHGISNMKKCDWFDKAQSSSYVLGEFEKVSQDIIA